MLPDSHYHLPFRGLPFEVRSMIWAYTVPHVSRILPYCGSQTVPRSLLAPTLEKDAVQDILSSLRIATSCQEAREQILTALFVDRPVVLLGNPFIGIRNLSAITPPFIRPQMREIILSRPRQGTAWAEMYQPGLSKQDSDFLKLAQEQGFRFNALTLESNVTSHTENWVVSFVKPLLEGRIKRLGLGPIGNCTDEHCKSRVNLFHSPLRKLDDGSGGFEMGSWGSRCRWQVHIWKRRFELIAAYMYEEMVDDHLASDIHRAKETLWQWLSKGPPEETRTPGLVAFGSNLDMGGFLEKSQAVMMECEMLYPIRVDIVDDHMVLQCEEPEDNLGRINERVGSFVRFDDRTQAAITLSDGPYIPGIDERRRRLLKMGHEYAKLRTQR